MPKVLVDADACPVKSIVVEICKKYNIESVMFADYAHVINDNYSTVVSVDTFADSVDFKLINYLTKGDVVVTQDFGLATMVLAKKGIAVHQNGFCYTDENIDKMLFDRHINKKMRQSGKRGSNIPKRTNENNLKFKECFEKIIQEILKGHVE